MIKISFINQNFNQLLLTYNNTFVDLTAPVFHPVMSTVLIVILNFDQNDHEYINYYKLWRYIQFELMNNWIYLIKGTGLILIEFKQIND